MATTDFTIIKDEDLRMAMSDIIVDITTLRTAADPSAKGSANSLKNKISALKAKIVAATLNITEEQRTDLVAHNLVLTTMSDACDVFIAACVTFAEVSTWNGK